MKKTKELIKIYNENKNQLVKTDEKEQVERTTTNDCFDRIKKLSIMNDLLEPQVAATKAALLTNKNKVLTDFTQELIEAINNIEVSKVPNNYSSLPNLPLGKCTSV